MKTFILVVGFVSVWFAAIGIAAEQLSYLDLVGRLTDLERLALLPAPGETCSQWSSYDRSSVYDAASGQYVKWEANGDGDGLIRKEGNRLVLAEMTGPGCIWRIWSAMPKEGHIKFYLDGSDSPAIDLPFIGLFDRKHAPFTRPALVHESARGQNCYVPIPYQKSCKIVVEGEWGRYYHFTYTTYPAGTVVPTFTMNLSAAESAALDRANEVLSKGEYCPMGIPSDASVGNRTVTIEPGETFVAELDGPRAVRAFGVKIQCTDRADEIEALRQIVLKVTWDYELQPAVWSPLGDFFGTAPGINKYRSLPMGMTDDGFYCNWYMPFATWTKWEYINEGDKPRTLELKVVYESLKRPIEQYGRFHAKWHRDAFVSPDPKRWPDWTVLATQGTGRFCGMSLHVWHPKGGPCPEVAWCKGHYWWGEGDEKFFVDGEKFPSTFGTGTEDYFGYAWGDPTLFSNAYHNQTISNGNKGHISVNRWHIPDNIPFRKSVEIALEKYFPNSWPTLYDATAYWYQSAGTLDPYPPVALSERLGYWIEPPVYQVKGALEGETLKILSKSAGNPRPQGLTDRAGTWSNQTHLWWTDAKPNDVLELALPVAKDGTYNLMAQFTKAVDYGIVQFFLDGRKIGDPMDFYNDGVIATGEIDLGVFNLKNGEHILKAQITGANDKAKKSYMFGLDYLRFQPAVDTRFDFGGFQRPGKWFKGNLHLHSTISDGNLDPVPTVEVYRKAGYDFTALTDHIGGFWDKEKKVYKPLVYPLDEMNKPGFLVIPAIEYDTNRNGETIHFVTVGPGYDQRLEDNEDLSKAMKKWWDAGAFSFMAHPHWSLDATTVLEDMSYLPAVEVFNYATALEEGLRGNSQMHWDRLLRKSRPTLGVATDDSHRPGHDSCGGWVMVKSEALTADAIVSSLRSGHFYFSAGPTLENVNFDQDGILHVSCSPVATIRALSGVGKVAQVRAKSGKTITEAAIKWDWKNAPFVRVECTDEKGQTAWSQAVMRITEAGK